MFTDSGQPDLSFSRVVRGGKGGGGGQQPMIVPPQPRVYTDPVNGMTFTDDPNVGGGGFQNYGGGYYGMIPGGGGDGKTGSQKLNEEIAQRQAGEAAKSQSATDTANTTAAANTAKLASTKQSAYDAALQQAMRTFQLQGVDPNQYMQSDIIPTLQGKLSSIQDTDPNPGAAFPADLGQTILNNVTGGRRTQALNTLNQTFTPTYAQNLLPDSLTSQYSSDILNEQFNPLMEQLTNAQKRNTLTPAGYQAALDALNQKKTAAQSTVQNLGQGILASDRSGLEDYISGARSTANNLNLGSSFDPSGFIGGAASKGQADLANFGGALRSAVGDTKFADITDLINAGGAVQGATNPNAANPSGGVTGTSPSFIPEDQLAQRQRGLGNVGAF